MKRIKWTDEMLRRVAEAYERRPTLRSWPETDEQRALREAERLLRQARMPRANQW